jgi:hypothetical protein
MKRVTPVVLGAAALLVALDIVGALTRSPLGFPYSRLGAVSLFVYLSVGLLSSLRGGPTIAVFAAAAVGFLDGTLGPLAAWMVGPGPVDQTFSESRVFAYGIAVITATAAVSGLMGALAGTWLERRRVLRTSSRAISR